MSTSKALWACLWLVACAPPESSDGLFGRKSTVEIWHLDDEGAMHPIRVPWSAVPAHMAHGDAPNPIHVEQGASGGNGLPDAPLGRLTDALALAREMRQRSGDTTEADDVITILASPGLYKGTFSPTTLAAHPDWEALPVLIDAPGIALIGSTDPDIDADGLPTGTYDASTASTLVPDTGMPAGEVETLVFITDSTRDGVAWAGNDASVSGWVFDAGRPSGSGGTPFVVQRVGGVRLESLVIGPRFTTAINAMRAGVSADTVYVRGAAACSFCLAGADGELRASRIQDSLVGVNVAPSGLLSGQRTLATQPGVSVDPLVAPAHAEVTVLVEDSDLTGFNRNAISSGVRIVTLGQSVAPVVLTASADVVVRGTFLGSSVNGVSIDAGFVEWANKDAQSDVSLLLDGNHWSAASQAKLLVTFTRGQVAVGIGTPGNTPYLKSADWSVDLAGGDEAIAPNVWIDHPVIDPYGDPSIVLGNTLSFDGVLLPPPVCQGAFPTAICTP